MTTASELIAGALRLINVPGRGATLASEDQSNALLALQELLNTNAVSKQFVPGIKRHFFTLQTGSIYTYGSGSQYDFRSDAFGGFLGDPAPIGIESAYVRMGSVITNNELVSEYRFGNVSTWILTGGMSISDNELAVQSAVGTATQSLPAANLTGTRTYTIRMSINVNAGSAVVQLRNNGAAFVSYTLDASGNYDFDFVWPAGTVPDVRVVSTIADDFTMTLLSIIERGQPRLELPDGQGTDFMCRVIDQAQYNRQPVKGAGGNNGQGRVYNILYSRSAGQAGELRLDVPGSAGDILIMDVLTNSLVIENPNDDINLNPEAMQWLRYALADIVSGEYGKSLNQRQVQIMEDAWETLAAGTMRMNTLGVDPGLRTRRGRFGITTGNSQ